MECPHSPRSPSWLTGLTFGTGWILGPGVSPGGEKWEGSVSGSRLDFELDHEVGLGAVTAHGGLAALIEHFRNSGAAAAV